MVIVAALQFGIEMFMVRNYAAATVFITAIALTISSGTHRLDVGALVLDRGLDTLIGCGAGLAVYLLMVRRQEASRIHRAIAEVLRRTTTVTTFLADGAESSLAGRAARRPCRRASSICTSPTMPRVMACAPTVRPPTGLPRSSQQP